jgi:hypothetical protein
MVHRCTGAARKCSKRIRRSGMQRESTHQVLSCLQCCCPRLTVLGQASPGLRYSLVVVGPCPSCHLCDLVLCGRRSLAALLRSTCCLTSYTACRRHSLSTWMSYWPGTLLAAMKQQLQQLLLHQGAVWWHRWPSQEIKPAPAWAMPGNLQRHASSALCSCWL